MTDNSPERLQPIAEVAEVPKPNLLRRLFAVSSDVPELTTNSHDAQPVEVEGEFFEEDEFLSSELIGKTTRLGEIWREHFSYLRTTFNGRLADAESALEKDLRLHFQEKGEVLLDVRHNRRRLNRDATTELKSAMELGIFMGQDEAVRISIGRNSEKPDLPDRSVGPRRVKHQDNGNGLRTEIIDEVKDETRRRFLAIIGLEDEIVEELSGISTRNPKDAEELIGTFVSYSESESVVEKDLAAIIANNQRVFGADSLLSQAIAMIEGSARSGQMANEFLNQEISKNDGDNLIGFVVNQYLGGNPEGLARLAGDYSDWPSDIKLQYEQFYTSKINSIKQSLAKAMQVAERKAWRYPIEIGDPARPKTTKSKPATKTRNLRPGPARTTNPDIASTQPSSDATSEKPKKTLSVRINEATLVNIEPEQIDKEMVSELFGLKKLDAECLPSLIKIINAICQNSTGPGIRSFKSGASIEVNGKKQRLYRFAPKDRAGVPVHPKLRGSRVVFYPVNGSIVITKIFTNHDLYEAYADSF